MTLTTYQKDIINYFNANPSSNMYINAKAGCGKSFIATQMLKDVDKNSIYLAFNKSIAEEMKEKITNPKVKVCTIHSLCNSILLYNLQQKVSKQGGLGKQRDTDSKLDNLKIYRIINDILVQDQDVKRDFEYKTFLTENYVKLYNLVRLKVIDLEKGYEAKDKIKEVIKEQGLFFHEIYGGVSSDIALKVIRQIDAQSLLLFEKEKIYDFTDMLYITLKKLFSKEWEIPYWNYYTNIVVDEAQDLSTVQLFLLKFFKRQGGRYIFVLDPRQCQPYGTKILMRNGEQKNIEDIEIGEDIVEYSSRQNAGFVGYSNTKPKVSTNLKVIDKQEFTASEIIKITSFTGRSSSYTPEHQVLVKFNQEAVKNAYCLYLMHKEEGNYFRIGIVHMYGTQTSLGLRQRCNSEGFDKAWILDIYDSHLEAWVNEQAYSLKYQIPQCIFQFDKVNYSQEDVDFIYSGVKDNMQERAINLLTEFHRKFECPLYTVGDIYTHMARTHSFVTSACNIIAKYMDCVIFDKNALRFDSQGHKKNIGTKYDNIISCEYQQKETKVIGLTTSKYHTYVADEIATHNCIYSFAGANAQSYMLIKKLFSPIKEFELPINYRCARSHLDLVNKLHHIGIKPCDTAPTGNIRTIGKQACIDLAEAGDYIVGRKNKWLFPIILELIKKGKPVYIKDDTLVKDIEKIIDKSSFDSIVDLERYIINKQKRLKKKIEENSNKAKETNEEETQVNPEDNVTIEKQTEDKSGQLETLSILQMLLAAFKENYTTHSKSQFLKYVKSILNTTSSNECIMVSSIHCVKGLEAQNVFVLNEGKTVIDGTMSSDQKQQEFNLSYVSLTRAKENLYLVRAEGEEY